MKKLAHMDKISETEWHELRRNGIGGSDIATIFNLNPWKSAFSLFLEKKGELEPPDLSDNESIYFGNIHEDMLRKEFAKRNGYKVQRNNFVLCHDEYDYLRANLDGEIITTEGKGVLEIKTTSEYMKSEWQGDHVPNAYMLQVQFYLGVTGYSFGFLVCLIGGNKYKQFRIERDEELIQLIFAECHAFWKRLQEDNPPPFDGSKSTADTLARMFPAEREQDSAIMLDHDTEAAQLLTRHTELTALIKQLEAEQTELENKLKGKIGEHTKANCFDYVISWKAPAQGYTIAAKDLQAVAPEVYEQIKKPKKQTRRFSIKVAK